uniref:O-methyltransferase dimerisation domain-containing protein n=1 Tax=Lactuca sativa TaxID=4236 RepID=A0A9R1VTM5_LACSA|nr:hypothetical protein LSAT_V11C400167590 [Lactuca sativa]
MGVHYIYDFKFSKLILKNQRCHCKMGSNPKKCYVHSQAHIWNHIFSFVNSMSLKCAIELQIPDIIDGHGAPMLLSELVEALPINKERTTFIYRLMRILVHSGFFVKRSLSTTTDNDEVIGYKVFHE